MRKFLLAVTLALCVGSNFGCALPGFSGDPIRRTREMLFVSENLRLIMDEWERLWFLDMPATTTPFRTHGGII